MEAWAIEALQELQGEGSPARIIKLCTDINSEGRKLEYRGSGLRIFEKNISKAIKLVTKLQSQLTIVKTKNLSEEETYGLESYFGVTDTLKSLKQKKALYYDALKRHISETRAAAQQIMSLVEKVKVAEGRFRDTEARRKEAFPLAIKYASSMIQSITFALNNLVDMNYWYETIEYNLRMVPEQIKKIQKVITPKRNT